MKKHLLTIICLIPLFAGNINAQPKPDLKSFDRLRDAMSADKSDSWHTLSFLYKPQIWIKQHFTDSLAKKPLNRGVIGYYGNGTLAQLNNTKEIELAAMGITLQNAGKYLYHVVLNDSVELLHWTKPTIFRSNKFINYAYLGKFKCRGQMLKLEIYEIDSYKNKAVITINGGYNPVPKITYLTLCEARTRAFEPTKLEYTSQIKEHYFKVNGKSQQPMRFIWTDSISYISVKIANTIQNDLYQVFLKREYKGYKIFWPIGNNWQQHYHSRNPELHINANFFKNPGEYTVIIKPKLPDGFEQKDSTLVATATFTVLPGPISFPLQTVLLIIFIILTTVAFMFVMYRRQQKRKLAVAAKNKQIVTLQLQSVRAQLNPHFIFNALAGIQNLMNKNEVENANKYLSRFARLTRHILDDSGNELIAIEKEVSLLTDYLQMEQTRFGFKYHIELDTTQIDQQVEIPAMLLQPFIENAVKHGVSALKDAGFIKVGFDKQQNDLILTVQDNGNGFGEGNTAGKGMKLSRERIDLLNGIYKNTAILLEQTSGGGGTLIIIKLQNWL